MKKILLPIIFVISLINSSWAFQPVAHIILQRFIAKELRDGNVFKEAMTKHPKFAAWGAVGPDLAYVPVDTTAQLGFKRKYVASSRYADIAHYYKTGTFCQALIEVALKQRDTALIAFAAGWLTHVAGDFGSHGYFVHPVAGYFLDSIEGQGMHSKMERWAEAIIFVDHGREVKVSCYSGEPERLDRQLVFDSMLGMMSKCEANRISELLSDVFRRVYGMKFNFRVFDAMSHYNMAFGASLAMKVDKWGMKNYDTSIMELKKLKDSDVKLNEAFSFSVNWGKEKLARCINNQFADFSNTWNLDVGPRAKTLIVKAKIDTQRFSGSKNPIYITFSSKREKKVRLNYAMPLPYIFGTNVRYNRSDVLLSYIYLGDDEYDDQTVYSFSLRKKGWLKDKTSIEELTIEDNTGQLFKADSIKIGYRKKEYKLSKPLSKV